MSTAVLTERSGKTVGRTVGVLLFLHLAVGLMVPFLMLKAIMAPLWKIALVKSASRQLDG